MFNSLLRIFLLLYLIFFNIARYKCKLICPYGWQWNRAKSLCIVSCSGQAGLSPTNVNCQLPNMDGHSPTYNANNNTLTILPGESLFESKSSSLPFCYNVTFNSSEYNVTADGKFQLNYRIPPIYSYNLNVRDNSVTICFPLSPQLQQCDTVATTSSDYELKNGSITIASKNITAYLGDFYINEDGVAYTCSQGVNVSLYAYPRCKYVKINSQDYTINENGSMFIHQANFTIKNPIYSFVIGKFTHVCIPLSIQFLNCKTKILWEEYYYHINSNLSATNELLRITSAPDYFYVDIDAKLTQCFSNKNKNDNSQPEKIYYLGIALSASSALCLTITLFVKLKYYKKNYHTKCLLSHILCLIIMYLAITIKRFFITTNVVSCYLLYVFLYYSSMGAFFWLNVIAYDSWRTFTRLQTSPYTCHCKCYRTITNHIRFIIYSIYSWGMALLFTVLTFIVDLAPMPRNIMFLNPHISSFCYFNNIDSTTAFYYIPLGIIMLTNLVFFILTIHIILHASKGTETVNRDRRKQNFLVAVKLFIVMGLCWIVDVIAYSLKKFDSDYFKSWYISNTVPASQGIFIFIVYFVKKKFLSSVCTQLYIQYQKFKTENVSGNDTPLHDSLQINNSSNTQSTTLNN